MRNGAVDETFEELADGLAVRRGVARNSRGSLLGDDGTVRAMTSGGRIVVRLEPDRVLHLVEAGRGRHYKSQRNRWIELDESLDEAETRALVYESLGLEVEG